MKIKNGFRSVLEWHKGEGVGVQISKKKLYNYY